MTFLALSFFAGVLTVLAPCILPLLPVIIGSSAGARSRLTPYIVIGSLSLSILIFTYLLKASTLFIDIPQSFWAYFSGGVLVLIGLIFAFPKLWELVPGVQRVSVSGNKLIGEGHQQKSVWGDVLIGAALGPVFSSCSPTYFLILATVLPESFLVGTMYLIAYIAGLAVVLLGIALIGQRFVSQLTWAANPLGWFKRSIGVLFLIVGFAIITGLDKTFEAWILDSGFNTVQFENRLLEDVI
ncbi:cytochrome C biogenesis protein [Candidatus Pacebacteria bacterium]|nr:cytochrome C biogenesis protein [Candidatus Paceibacterota bacterium]